MIEVKQVVAGYSGLQELATKRCDAACCSSGIPLLNTHRTLIRMDAVAAAATAAEYNHTVNLMLLVAAIGITLGLHRA